MQEGHTIFPIKDEDVRKDLLDEHPKSKAKVNLYTWLVSFTSGLGGFLFGYEIGIINQVFTMLPFKLFFGLITYDADSNTYHSSPDRADIEGWITFTFLIGAALGALIVSYPMNLFGRKRTIIGGGSIFLVSVIIQSLSTGRGLLYLGRLGAGIGVGIESATVPVYISETAETSIRGRLIGTYQLMITCGIFFATCVNSVIILAMGDDSGDLEWRMSFALQLIPCLLMMVSMSFMPLSPRWLIYRGRTSEALQVLIRLRGKDSGDDEVIREHQDMLDTVEQQKRYGETSWSQLFTDPYVRYRTFLGVSLQFFQQWTGINVILYFGAALFDALGFSPMLSTIGFPLINSLFTVLATLPGMYLIERWGRKKLLVWGGACMSVSLLLVTLFGHIGESQDKLDTLGIGAILFVFTFTLSFGSTWGPVVWVYQAEIFPFRYRAKATSISTVSNWVWNSIVSKSAPLLLSAFGFKSYLLWAGFCAVMAVFAHFCVPETKGLSLEEINEFQILVTLNPAIPMERSVDASPTAASTPHDNPEMNQRTLIEYTENVCISSLSLHLASSETPSL
ncbi:hypothetical protein PROFUN_11079 [Planoprotostelium fungivorum]|uniref:Major facilitator superfamily (MFS) profile domain-containing protein n=1 Tax=Planoprotostelium fungivorum TaxID=1890364 RepID=A0A2P6NAI3_9EUKA|nr:hypothetical protein PROFUN_11079 [Planoprotostelium fungivorum]